MPIGSVLSGSLAVLYSVVWSRRFKTKLNFAVSELANFSELLRKVYIDDNTVVTTPTPPGARLNDSGKLVIIEELVGEDLEIPADQRTAKIYEEIATSVSSCVAVTTDCPSNNNSSLCLC